MQGRYRCVRPVLPLADADRCNIRSVWLLIICSRLLTGKAPEGAAMTMCDIRTRVVRMPGVRDGQDAEHIQAQHKD